MNWSKDALFSKAKLFMGKAFEEDKDSPYFGIFSAMGLELLARAAVASVHPALLAEPDASQKNIMYALGLNDAASSPKSIATNRVLALCGDLFPSFNSDLEKMAKSMTERRNEELHSGGAAFQDYNQDHWIGGFYKACKVLVEAMGKSMDSLFGRARAEEAEALIAEGETAVKKSVMDMIRARKKTYEEDLMNDKERVAKIIEASDRNVTLLSHQGYHVVDCPCCGNKACIHGRESSNSHEQIQEDEVIVKKDVIPDSFYCHVCGLRLTSYAELQAAELPLHYTNTYNYDPVEFFSIDVDELIKSDAYQDYRAYLEEYSNE